MKLHTLETIIDRDSKLTFLVGAGCSIKWPSCQPSGYKMKRAIINFSCAESEINNILNLKELRFEALVEIFRDHFDKKLTVLDFFTLCKTPNIQHFFLAEMIKNGHYVITTNFDNLIEHALLQLGIPKDDIQLIITKADYKKIKDPEKLGAQGKKVLLKIHGSPYNLITEKDTKSSLIATIQALGANKNILNLFQVEGFKYPLFEKISQGRSLIVLGYSGSDDFDIVPTLKILKGIKNFIWINHISDEKNFEKIYEINNDSLKLTDKTDKIDQILYDIKKSNHAERVFRIDTNTTELIKKLITINPNLSKEGFSIKPLDWIINNIEPPDDVIRYGIANKIFYTYEKFNDALRCAEKLLSLSRINNNSLNEADALNNIGKIYLQQGKFEEAIQNFNQAFHIYEQLQYIEGKINSLNSISRVYSIQGQYPDALRIYNQSLEFNKELNDPTMKSILLNNMGEIYLRIQRISKAESLFSESLQISETLGNFNGMAASLNNLAFIYLRQGKYNEALGKFEICLQINNQIPDLLGKITCMNNMGGIYYHQGKIADALKIWEEGLRLSKGVGDITSQLKLLENLGGIHFNNGNFKEAQNLCEEALHIAKKLNIIPSVMNCLNTLGVIYQTQGNHVKALDYSKSSLELSERLGNHSSRASCLNNIGSTYLALGESSMALQYFTEALDLFEELNDFPNIIATLSNIGNILQQQKQIDEALKYLKRALQICQDLGKQGDEAKLLKNIGTIYYNQRLYDKALKQLNNALQINQKIQNPFEIAQCSYRLALTYNSIGHDAESLRFFKTALELYNQLGLDSSLDAQDCKKHITLLQQKIYGKKSKEHKKIGRNAPCPCGSGRKFKKCCGKPSLRK